MPETKRHEGTLANGADEILRCPVEMRDLKPCGRPSWGALVNGTAFCLMHTPMGKDDGAFQKEFERILEAAGVGVADFTRFVFPSANYSKRVFAARCVFERATFTQYAKFGAATFAQYANFGEATFAQDANFGEATFRQNASFIGATFTLDADFSGATFTQNATFFGAKFTQNATFFGAKFTQNADFSLATFRQNANFNEATFTQNADFSLATFTQNVYFSEATFTQIASFIGATFTKNAVFTETKFKNLVTFQGTQFGGRAEFRQTQFRNDDTLDPSAVFSLALFSQPESVIFYKTDLGQTLFHLCDVSKIVFSAVTWRPREPGTKRMVFDEVVDLKHEAAEDLKPPAGSPDERGYQLIAELYQQLKKNYDERKDYWAAGDFHYGEMEMKHFATPSPGRLVRWLASRGLTGPAFDRLRSSWHQELGLVAWYKRASSYGESYARPASWLILVLVLFALLYPVAGLRYDPSKDQVVGSRVELSPAAPSAPAASSSQRGATGTPEPIVLSYRKPYFPEERDRSHDWRAVGRLLRNSCFTALDVAAFQKEPAYAPLYPWGHLLALVEMLLTSTLFALFLLAVRRQFRR